MGDNPKTTLADGSPVTPDHREINPSTGQQKGYVVLSKEERAKGFVRPLRNKYIHIGAPPKNPLRELTSGEHERYDKFGYVMYEEYPGENLTVTGRFWTKEQLENRGCHTVTTMSLSIAETYARQPDFYNGTFCCNCGKHFPLIEFVWEGTSEIVGS